MREEGSGNAKRSKQEKSIKPIVIATNFKVEFSLEKFA
jgi:hypothetical protein